MKKCMWVERLRSTAEENWEEGTSVQFLKNLKGGRRERATREGQRKELPGTWDQPCCGKEKVANTLVVSSRAEAYKES